MHTLFHLFAAAGFGPLASTAVPAPATPPAQGAGNAASSIIPDISLSWGSYFQALAILCFILALLWGVLWLLKRHGSGGLLASSGPSMRIESRLAIGPKNWLYIVRCMDKRLVLGVSDKNITLISESFLTEEELQPAPKKSLFSRKRAAGQQNEAPSGSLAARSVSEESTQGQTAPEPSFADVLKGGKQTTGNV